MCHTRTPTRQRPHPSRWLGAIFALIGEAAVVESRSAKAQDGTLVARGRGRKWGFDRTETMTVFPNGRVDHGLAPGRAGADARGAMRRTLRERRRLWWEIS